MLFELAQRTIRDWLDECNTLSQLAFEQGCVSNNVRLHHLNYKAEEVGIALDVVAPRNTLRVCSHCGYCDKGNRCKHDFHCKSCDYRLHSDLNAAQNIQQRSMVVRRGLCDDRAQINRLLSADSRIHGQAICFSGW